MGISKKEYISRGSGENLDKIQTVWFLQHTEEMAIRLMPNVEADRMRSMWKEAHGHSLPNYTTKASVKSQRKRKTAAKD